MPKAGAEVLAFIILATIIWAAVIGLLILDRTIGLLVAGACALVTGYGLFTLFEVIAEYEQTKQRRR